MRANTAKQAMHDGGCVYGYAMALGSPVAAELMSVTGIDFLLFDMQHGSFGSESLALSLMATGAGTAIPMARPARNDYTLIAKLLDEGAMGIVVPMVDTPEQARAAADACRFPPTGARSHGWSGAGRLGEDYFDRIDDELFVAVQIESALAVANAEAIMSTPGIDGCWIGPADLALSLGLHPETAWHDPRFQAALTSVVEACHRAGKVPGFAAFTPEHAVRARELGFRFLTSGWDIGFLTGGARAGVAIVRE